jgi:hypothetical protein
MTPRSKPSKGAETDDWSVRPINIGTCHHRTISRAQQRHQRKPLSTYLKKHGQYIHHAHLYPHLYPKNAIQSQDAINAFNQVEPEAVANGIMIAPPSIQVMLPYFKASTTKPTPAYMEGQDAPAYQVHKLKQGDPNATAYCSLAMAAMHRTMIAELNQHPSRYHTLTIPHDHG